jgi:hypothetical protein
VILILLYYADGNECQPWKLLIFVNILFELRRNNCFKEYLIKIIFWAKYITNKLRVTDTLEIRRVQLSLSFTYVSVQLTDIRCHGVFISTLFIYTLNSYNTWICCLLYLILCKFLFQKINQNCGNNRQQMYSLTHYKILFLIWVYSLSI